MIQMTTEVGLFSEIEAGATLRDFRLTNATVVSSASAIVGSVAGGNKGTIAGVSATGSVTGSNAAGGLVASTIGSIELSHVDVNVSAPEAGGLVAQNGNGTITECYATGEVFGSQLAGGLVG